MSTRLSIADPTPGPRDISGQPCNPWASKDCRSFPNMLFFEEFTTVSLSPPPHTTVVVKKQCYGQIPTRIPVK